MNDELDSTAAKYVLGTLTTAERQRFAERMRSDAKARKAVRSWQERFALRDSAVADHQGGRLGAARRKYEKSSLSSRMPRRLSACLAWFTTSRAHWTGLQSCLGRRSSATPAMPKHTGISASLYHQHVADRTLRMNA
jgi:anti-sigma-K factor RskA